jgi:gamma-glutamyltranspeptidase/glutathione hydrolase
MPSSFYPRHAQPGWVEVEDRIEPGVLAELERRGHRLRPSGPWAHGRVLAATHDAATGLCEAAASPRFRVAAAAALP